MKNDQGSASYEEIFGDVVTQEADEARSVLSPAAYFTDLMLLKENELQKTFEEDIDKRRPDISAIPLNRENTFNEIPYLDIVNEVMADRMETELKNSLDFAGMDAFDVLKNAKTSYPFQSVFNKDYSELQHVLNYHKTNLAELNKTLSATQETTRLASDYLGINKVVKDLLITKNITKASLQNRWGLGVDEDPVNVLKNLQTMLKKAGLSDKEFQKILSQNLSQDELNLGKAGEFFINNVMMPGNPRAEKAFEIYTNTGRRIWQSFGGQSADFSTVDMLVTNQDENVAGLNASQVADLAMEFKQIPFDSDAGLHLTRREYRIKYHSRKLVKEWAQKLAFNLSVEADIDRYAQMLEDVYKIKNVLEPITIANDINAFLTEIQKIWDFFRRGIVNGVLAEMHTLDLNRGLTTLQVQTLADECGVRNHPALAMTANDITYWQGRNLIKSELRMKFHLRKLILDLAHDKGHSLASQAELTEYANALETPFYAFAEFGNACNTLYSKKCDSIWQAFGGKAGNAPAQTGIPIYESEKIYNITFSVVNQLVKDYNLRTFDDKALTTAQIQSWANKSATLSKMQYRIKFHCRRVVLNLAKAVGYRIPNDVVYSNYADMLESIYTFDTIRLELIPAYIKLLFNEVYKNIWVQLGVLTNFPENTDMVEISPIEDYTGVTKKEVEALADEYGLRTLKLLPLTKTEINTLVAAKLTKTALRIKFHSRALILKHAIAINVTIASRSLLEELVVKLEEVYQYAKTKIAAIQEDAYEKYTAFSLFVHEISNTIISETNASDLIRDLTIAGVESIADEYGLRTNPLLPMTAADINYWHSLNLTKAELRIRFRLRKLILGLAQEKGRTFSTQAELTEYAKSLEVPYFYLSSNFNEANYRLYRNKCQSIWVAFGGQAAQAPVYYAIPTYKSEYIYNIPASDVYALMADYNLRTFNDQELNQAQKDIWANQSATISKMDYRIKFHSRRIVLNYAKARNFTLTEDKYNQYSAMLESIYNFDHSRIEIVSLYTSLLFNEMYKNIWVEQGVLTGFPENTPMLQTSPVENYNRLNKAAVVALATEYHLNTIGLLPITDAYINSLVDLNLTKTALRIKFHSRELITNYAIAHNISIPTETRMQALVAKLESVYQFATEARNTTHEEFKNNYISVWLFIHEIVNVISAGTSDQEVNRGLSIEDVETLADEYGLRTHPILVMTNADIIYWQGLNLSKVELRLKFRLRKIILDLARTKGHAIPTQAKLTVYAETMAAPFYFGSNDLGEIGYRLYKNKYESIWAAFGGQAGQAPATYGVSTTASENIYNIPRSEVDTLIAEYNLRTYNNQELTDEQKQAWASQSGTISKTQYRIKFHSRQVVQRFALARGFSIPDEAAYAAYSAMLESCYVFDISRLAMVALYSKLLFEEVYKNVWIELGVLADLPGTAVMVEPPLSEDYKDLSKAQIDALADEYGLRSISLLPLTDAQIYPLLGLNLSKAALRIKFHSRALILDYAIAHSIGISSHATLDALVAKLENVYQFVDNAQKKVVEEFTENYKDLWETMGGFGSRGFEMLQTEPNENYKGLSIYEVKSLAEEYLLLTTAIQPMDMYDVLRLHEKNLTKSELRIKFKCRRIVLDLTEKSQYELLGRESLDYYTDKVGSAYLITSQLASIPDVRSLFKEAFRKVLVELGEQPGPDVTAEMIALNSAENYCGHSQSEVEVLADEYGLRTMALWPLTPDEVAYLWPKPVTLTELRIKFHARSLILNYAMAHAIAISDHAFLSHLIAILEAVYDSGKYSLTAQRVDKPSLFAEKQRRIWVALGGNYSAYVTVPMQETTRDEQYTLLTKEEIGLLASNDYGMTLSETEKTKWYEQELTKAELKIKFHSRHLLENMLASPSISTAVKANVRANMDLYAALLEAIYVDEGKTYLCLNNFRKDLPTLEHLDLLNRFMLLCQVTGWTAADADLMLRTACKNQLDEPALTYIAALKYLQDRSGLALDVLCSFWADMKNWGDGQGSYPEHLFYRVFDKGQRILILNEPYKNIANPELEKKSASAHIKSRVQSSISLKEQDLKLLLDSLDGFLFAPGQPKNITLSNLTMLYRFAKLAKLYQISITELLTLLDILDQMWLIETKIPIIPFIPTTLQVTPLNSRQVLCQTYNQDMQSVMWLLQVLAGLLDWLKDINLTVKQLAVLCSRTMISGEEGFLATKDRTDLMAKILDQIAGQLILPAQLQSSRMDARSATKFFQELVTPENDCLTAEGLVSNLPAFGLMEGMVKKVLNKKIVLMPSDFAGMGLDAVRYMSLLNQLADVSKQYVTLFQEDVEGDPTLETLGEFTDLGRAFFTGDNQTAFLLSGFSVGETGQIFTIIAAKANRLQLELDGAGSETEEILGILTTRQEQQLQIVLNAMEAKLGLDSARLKWLCQAIYLSPTEPERHLLVRMLVPMMQAAVTPPTPASLAAQAEATANLYLLQQFVLLVKKVGLGSDQLRILLAKLNYINRKTDPQWNEKPAFTLSDILDFTQFSQLTGTYSGEEYNLLNFYEDTTQTTAKLSQATQWEQTQVDAIFAANILHSPVDIGTIRTIMEIKEIMDYCRKLAITPETMIHMVWPNVFGTPEDIPTANNLLLESLKTKTSDKDWVVLSNELQNTMNREKRNALLPYLLNLLSMENSRDLYSELLLDVDMNENALTSRINEAIACAQLYYHRTLTNLETWEASKEKLDELKRWWIWMKNYRVWEANRKVFLYPENYIRPELRGDKSPVFKALEEELLQTDITAMSVQTAYKNYLEKFAMISSLIIAGGSVFQKVDGTYAVMFGFARSAPIKYFYRVGKVPANEFDSIDWEPWLEINMLINADRVYPVYAFNRLFVFWLEYRDKNETSFSSTTTVSSNSADIRYDSIINYSFYNLSKEWIVPQQLMEVGEKVAKTPRYWTKAELKNFEFKAINPSFSSEYDDQEYIYIKYTIDPTIVGRLTSELTYEKVEEAELPSALKTTLNSQNQFPESEFGIKPRSSIEWQTNFEDTFSLPWFSFDAKGGNFLCKPAKVPKVTKDDVVFGTPFTEVTNPIDAGFKDNAVNNSKTHVFSGLEYYVYDSLMQNVFAGLISDRWGNLNVFQDSTGPLLQVEHVETAFILGGVTHIITTNYHLYYNAANYTEYTAVQTKTAFSLNLGTYSNVLWGSWNWASIDNAFIYNGAIYIFNGTQYTTKDIDELLAETGLSQELEGAFVKDNILYVTAGTEFNTYEYETAQRNWKTVRTIWGNGIWGTNIANIKAAFNGRDNNKWYFFSEAHYVGPYNGSGDDDAVKPLSDQWGNKPNIFTDHVDAAFMDNLGRIYLFSDNLCIQYDNINSRFPTNFQTTSSSSSWLKLADVDAIVRIDEKIYAFVGGVYHVYTEAVKGTITKVSGYPLPITGNWSNLPGNFNKKVEAGFYVGDDLYLCHLETVDSPSYVCYSVSDLEKWPYEVVNSDYHIIRLTSNTAQKFSQKLFANGVSGLLELNTQEEEELPKFEKYPKPAVEPVDTIYYKADRIPRVPPSRDLDFLSANGNYYWEIFFHTPFLIAQTLNTAQKQDEAQTWYQFIYDPMEKTSSVPLSFTGALHKVINFDTYKTRYQYDSAKKRLVVTGPMSEEERISFIQCYETDVLLSALEKKENVAAIAELFKRSNIYYFWKFLPFHQDPPAQTFGTQYQKYRDDPFDPHAIAALRQIAYRKALVMSYIDNLMDWGDKLFLQYTRESINEARMLYVLAYDLLGGRPEKVIAKQTLPVQSYYQIYTELYPAEWYKTLLELENSSLNGYVPDAILESPGLPNDDFVTRGYFTIPENDYFVTYWDRVEDRLYKIRNGLNIEGVKQALPLFQPPIDPMALVQAVAGGGGLAAVLANFDVTVPHYRFTVILAKTKEFTGRVIQLGGAFLSALEKKDAEDMSLLRNTQENSILKMTLEIKNDQLENAKTSVESLKSSLGNAEDRKKHYENLIKEGFNPYEITQLVMTGVAQAFTTVAQVMNTLGGVSRFMPKVGSPFALTYGGEEIGSGFLGIGSSFTDTAQQFNFASNLCSTLGSWDRRKQDWELQKTLAGDDVVQITHQIVGAVYQTSAAQKEINVQEKQIKHNEAIDDFLKSKFTNKQLYMWMISQIKTIYFQSYKMALELAKIAQKAFQYETGFKASDVNFITPVYWDSLHEGLLAGEKLQYDLDRMDKAYMEKNKRRFEISKTVSLAALDPLALVKLKEKRVCEFNLNERLFDQDFPGHYCRQIKTISVSFPAIVGQYQNLNATLTQMTHRTLIEPDKEGLLYLLAPQEGQQMPLSIRADWRPNQQVALSRAENDNGLFQLNFQDERYLPFEGTGAVSSWRLELNGALGSIDCSKIQDVIIKVEYTALQGGEAFANEAKQNLPMEDGFGLMLLKQAFNDSWNQFMLNPAQGITFTLESQYCPNIFEDDIRSIYMQYDLTEAGGSELKDLKLNLTTETMTEPKVLSHGTITDTQGVKVDLAWTIKPQSSGQAVKFKPENIRNIALIVIFDTKVSF